MLLSVTTIIIVAVPAYAGTRCDHDAAFLKKVNDAGLTYKDPAEAVTAAKSVCDLLDKSTPETDIEKTCRRATRRSPGTARRRSSW